MTDPTAKVPATPLNASARAAADGAPRYAEPILGNPVSTLMESGVGNCFPGLEFDLRQLDVRFFPGLVFEFPGVTPAGPDGTQGARLLYADPGGDPIIADHYTKDGPEWITALKRQYAGPEGAALGDGTWYLHFVEQGGKRIMLYDYSLYQNAASLVPYEGETAWWIIRLIEPEKPLTIALTQRGEDGSPSGQPVVLHGRRRMYLNEEGMIDPVYHPGELTSSMCSPWTHDFRDCACHYWASNHPDVVLGEVEDPQLPNSTSQADAAQAVTFIDWMRRRHLPLKDVSAQTTLEKARPDRYDPYEINLHWEELDFVVQGQEAKCTKQHHPRIPVDPYESTKAVVDDLKKLAGMELTLAFEYLYAYFSLREPDEISIEEEAKWPGLSEDLRGARQLILSVALSEMTHLRWVNQTLWLIHRTKPEIDGKKWTYKPCLVASKTIDEPDPSKDNAERTRDRRLEPATLKNLENFEDIERPGSFLDTEYIKLVDYLRKNHSEFTEGLFQLAVRIDSDGMQHFQKFKDVRQFLGNYPEDVFLRDIKVAKVAEITDEDLKNQVLSALRLIESALAELHDAYLIEAVAGDMVKANAHIKRARDDMHALSDVALDLARKGVGVPLFDVFEMRS